MTAAPAQGAGSAGAREARTAPAGGWEWAGRAPAPDARTAAADWLAVCVCHSLSRLSLLNTVKESFVKEPEHGSGSARRYGPAHGAGLYLVYPT